ncbi:MAG: 50S ribosomal protein L24 [Anaerolineae bacterium]|nr:50S ribosomal protein L24 [Anaerolineae bacterium]
MEKKTDVKKDYHKRKYRIKKDDLVQVIAGNDKGARGRVIRVMYQEDRVVVEGVNIRKRHQKARQSGRSTTQAGIVQFEAPIHISNVMLVDPKADAPTRIRYERDAEGRKVRVAKKSGEAID